MAAKGMAVYTHQGEDYTINDPNIADEFSSSAAYTKGDYVNYQGNLYKFTENHQGVWNSGHVSQVHIGNEIKTIMSDVETLDGVMFQMLPLTWSSTNGLVDYRDGTFTENSGYKTTNNIDVSDYLGMKAVVHAAATQSVAGVCIYDEYGFFLIGAQIYNEVSGSSFHDVEIDIPTNASYMKFTISASAQQENAYAKVEFVSGGAVEDIKTLADSIEPLFEIKLAGNGTTDVSYSRFLDYGHKYAVIMPKLYNNSQAFVGLESNVLYVRETTTQIEYAVPLPLKDYMMPYIIIDLTSNVNNGYIMLSIKEDIGKEHIFKIIQYPDEKLLKICYESEYSKKKISEISVGSLKQNGLIAYDVPVCTPTNASGNRFKTQVIDFKDVNVGDVLYYSITLPDGYTTGFYAFIQILNSSNQQIAAYGKTTSASTEKNYSGNFTVTANMKKAIFIGNGPGFKLDYIGTKVMPLKLEEQIESLDERVTTLEESSQIQNVYRISNAEFNDTPITIFANDGADAIENVDDCLLNTVSVLKISDSMYYMYYESFGMEDEFSDQGMRLCFAYSTDGETFTKGFPSGVTPPFSGSTMLMPQGSTHGQCVVKVPDAEYPYRMIACTTYENRTYTPCVYKSEDGVNFTFVRALTGGGNDSPISCVVRGNLLKIFIRVTNTSGYRSICIMETDLDGNIYHNGVVNISSTEETHQLYQASAAILDDKREIMFPTIYNPINAEETVECYIIDGGFMKQVTINATQIVADDVKMIIPASGLVCIGLYTYLYYSIRDTDHQHFVKGTTHSKIRRARVLLS